MQPPITPGGGAPELGDYLTTLRYRKWYVVGTTLLVMVVAVLFTYLQSARYTAGAAVLVEVPQTSSQGGSGGPDMETERALAVSTTVAAMAAPSLNSDADPADLLRRVSVTVPTDTQLLQFTYTDASRDAAREGAAAFANAYLEMRRERFDRAVQGQVAPILGELRALRASLRSTEASAAAETDPARATTLANRANAIVTQIGLLQQRRRDIAATEGLSVGLVVDPAELPVAASNRHLLPTLLLAIAVGLILGAAAALIRERLDGRLRSEDEVEARSGAPTLATVPLIDGDTRKPLLLNGDAGSQALLRDAFRSLRTSMSFARRYAGTRVVLVTSPEGGDGKTTVTANLATSLADAGDRIVIVAGDLRKPTLSELFGVDRDLGLTTALRDGTDIGSTIVGTNFANLTIVPTGRIEANDVEQMRSDQLRDVFDRLAQDNDLVLVDGPPVLGVADTLALAEAADATLLVIDAKKTTKRTIDRTIRQLALVGTVVLGEVINNSTPSHFAYYASTDGTGREARHPSAHADDGHGQERTDPATP